MKLAVIKQAINEINDSQGDDETAHGLEDDLYTTFIFDIAKGHSSLAIRARLVLTTKDIDFSRWCA